MVPDGGDAARARRGEVLSQPLHLRRSLRRQYVAVQRDDVPVADLEAVIAEAALAGVLTEVAVVGAGAGGFVLVIAGCGAGPVPVASPGRLVALGELRRCALKVGVVPRGEDGALGGVEQSSRPFRAR